MAWARGSWDSTALLSRIEAWMVASRCAGSSTSVARLHSTAEATFPPSASLAVRRFTGTMAISGASGMASFSVR